MKLEKAYKPAEHEPGIYKLWLDSGAFKADPERQAERYSIAMPPPNATGALHLGHVVGIAVQDILVRYQRMQGKDVLWLPGTDHAAIATNAIMEKRLADEGTNKHEIGRDEFIKRLKQFVEDSRGQIRNQIMAMGASCDWSRERYTLDDSLNRCVNEMFVNMYNDGLIYRGYRIVNWDPNLETTISDDEIERQEEKAKFYTFKYGPFKISTARPETKFGDKYVVMHPDDKRYARYKEGDTFSAEWINGPVKAMVIKDKAVDPKFGTGVMTITPWHDHTDFDIAERHNLDKEQIIDFHGKLLPIAGEFKGMPIAEARPLIIKKLEEKGLLVSIDEDYIHSIALNSRGKGIIEPQIKLQWFVDVNKKVVIWKGRHLSLKEIMQDVIREGDIEIVPERFSKLYFHWIDNLRDWCISRQIWWGHRIPAWYRMVDDKEEIYVGIQPPSDSESQGWHQWEQDPDTLDTWFSSALWTWSTLIDPKLATDYSLSLEQVMAASIDYQTYRPTSLMETGWDILFFWVARMILATTYMTGDVPFKTVYLHGLVRNDEGQKMSKSKPESMIDPLDVIPKYGTDALRLALIKGTSPGNDQRLGTDKIADQRNFCNKLWNIARFIESTIDPKTALAEKIEPKSAADAWILYNLSETSKAIGKDLENYRFSEAYDRLYHFIWDDFADWYIEVSKFETNPAILVLSLETILKLAHPFAPFVTEAIWQQLGWRDKELLISQKWPKLEYKSSTEAKEFEVVKNFAVSLRYFVKELDLNKPLLINSDKKLAGYDNFFKRLARVGEVSSVKTPSDSAINLTYNDFFVWLEADKSKVKTYAVKLKDREDQQSRVVKQLKERLANKNYIKNAPEEIIQQTKLQLNSAIEVLENLKNEQNRFKN